MGAPEYVIGSPAFRHARVELQTVNAANNSRENVYVQSLKINGTPWTKTWVPHELIAKGATLDFVMGPQPSRWGSGVDDVPRSLTAVASARSCCTTCSAAARRQHWPMAAPAGAGR